MVLFSCGQKLSPEEEMIRETLDKTVNINLFDSIRKGGESFHFTEFREKYDYISLVYLEDGCNPCYPKFVDWHGKINSFLDYKNYTVLFVIRTNSYERFLEYASEYGDVEDHLYLVVDRHNRFLDNNRDIPRSILDRSVLIDRENKIKLIGPPFMLLRKWRNFSTGLLKEQICLQVRHPVAPLLNLTGRPMILARFRLKVFPGQGR